MGKRLIKILKIILLILAIAICLLILVYILLPKAGGRNDVNAKLYVNGELLEEPASIYWRGYSALASFPLIATLESLGCQVKEEKQEDKIIVTILSGDREFTVENGNLYEKGHYIYYDIARIGSCRGLFKREQYYLDISDHEKLLKALGFDQISCEIDEKTRVVHLNAESTW
ncbi:MAG: hypothetical protein IKO22_00765 [Oscillospiraceae bacterium]|nr:hypothetical protein [Oscillospiraceae bacterium]